MKEFCFNPFKRAQLSPSGNVYVCCSAWMGKSLGNIYSSNFRDIWNSKNAIKIRQSIIDETFQYCKRNICPKIISGNTKKTAVLEKTQIFLKSNHLLMDSGPEHLSLNYDHSCNLFCRSCRNKIMVKEKSESDKLIEFQKDLINSKLFQTVKRLTITGSGEPFSSRVFMDLFKRLDKKKYPELKITLRTNGILLNQRNWKHIKKIHYAIDKISISIDATTEKTYNLLRRGGNFKILKENLKFISSIKEKQNIRIKLNFVVQKQNFREMPDFVKLAETHSVDEVNFSKILDFKTYDPKEFSDLAVHQPEHPDFKELKKILKSPIFKKSIVSFGNLSHLIHQ